MMLWKCCTQYASKFGKLSSASGPINSREIDGETVETVSDFIFLGLQNHCRWWLHTTEQLNWTEMNVGLLVLKNVLWICKMLLILGEIGWGVYRNSLYDLCNFSVKLKNSTIIVPTLQSHAWIKCFIIKGSEQHPMLSRFSIDINYHCFMPT